MAVAMMKEHLCFAKLPIRHRRRQRTTRQAKRFPIGVHVHQKIVRTSRPENFGGGEPRKPLRALVPEADRSRRIDEVDSFVQLIEDPS